MDPWRNSMCSWQEAGARLQPAGERAGFCVPAVIDARKQGASEVQTESLLPYNPKPLNPVSLSIQTVLSPKR